MNDDWQSDVNHSVVESNGLAPANPLESAQARSLAPGAYTVIVTGKDATPGIGLVEVYDITTQAKSKFGNMSTRGSVGTGDNVLIVALSLVTWIARPWSCAPLARRWLLTV